MKGLKKAFKRESKSFYSAFFKNIFATVGCVYIGACMAFGAVLIFKAAHWPF